MIVKFLSFPTQLLYHRVFIFAMDSLSIYKICNKFKLSFYGRKRSNVDIMLSILLLNVHQHAAIQANTEELTKELGIFFASNLQFM